MPKRPKVEEVSKTTINSNTPLQDVEKTPEGYAVNSEEAKLLLAQRDFLANVAKPCFQMAADARKRYDQEWMARNLFWRGYQFSRYIPQTQTVVLTSRQSARIPVNLIASSMRAIRNQVTSFRPKFDVLPTSPNNESSKVQARYAQRLLDYYFDKLGLKMKIKETITQALLYSIGGPWQIVYDPIKKEVRVWLLDPFDFYFDPYAEDPNEGEFQIKAVRQPMGSIIHNPNYNPWARREITGTDAQLAASEYKQFMIQATKNITPQSDNNTPGNILKEGFYRRYKDDGTGYMVRCIWTDQNTTPLLYEELDVEDYDFIVYRGDLNPKEVYGESWIKHVMPINRVINSLESSAFEYNYRVAKGRIVVDRDSGVRAIHNVHGEIISKNRGAEVKSLDMAPLPVAVPQQIERMWRYMEDISGIHEASLGRVPTGVKTGVGIAELKQADATSQDDLVDNLEDFMADVGMKILSKIAENYTSYKVVKDLGVREGNEKYFAVIGSKFRKNRQAVPGHEGQVKIGPDWFDVAEIGDDNNIRVAVGSWLGYTKEALQQKVIQYYQMQLIDQSTALRLLEFGDIDGIVQQTRIEALMKKNIGQQSQPGEVDQMSLAMSENEMITEGKEPPVSELDDHLVHIAVHQEVLGRGMDEIVGPHIEQHQIYLGQNLAMPASNGYDLRDQQRAQQVGTVPEETPMGPPPGTQLPQQNVAQQVENTNIQAAENLGMLGGLS